MENNYNTNKNTFVLLTVFGLLILLYIYLSKIRRHITWETCFFNWLCFSDSLIVWIPTECCVSKNDSSTKVDFKFGTLILFQLLVKVTPRRTCKRIFSSQHQSLIGRVIQQPLGIGRLLAFIIKMYHPIPCKLICWFITLVFPRKIHAAWQNNRIQKVFPCCIILLKF